VLCLGAVVATACSSASDNSGSVAPASGGAAGTGAFGGNDSAAGTGGSSGSGGASGSGGQGGVAPDGSAGSGAGGAAGSGAAGSGGTGAGGASGAGGAAGAAGSDGGLDAGGAGGKKDGGGFFDAGADATDTTCATFATRANCVKCCGQVHPGAIQAEIKDATPCLCQATECQTECATTICATTPKIPDAACRTCFEPKLQQGGSCAAEATAACQADPVCAPILACVAGCP
jgi:hypothetical protein